MAYLPVNQRYTRKHTPTQPNESSKRAADENWLYEPDRIEWNWRAAQRSGVAYAVCVNDYKSPSNNNNPNNNNGNCKRLRYSQHVRQLFIGPMQTTINTDTNDINDTQQKNRSAGVICQWHLNDGLCPGGHSWWTNNRRWVKTSAKWRSVWGIKKSDKFQEG